MENVKTIENLRKTIDVKLIDNEYSLVKWVSRPTFIKTLIVSENLILIYRKKRNLQLKLFKRWI